MYFITGNNKKKNKKYLKKHLGIHIFKKKQKFVINDKKILIGHGDGIGKGEFGYKCLKFFLNCHINVWLFGLLPPKTGFAIAHFFSRKSRAMTPEYKDKFLGNNKEILVKYCYQYIVNHNVDYFIFGHRHLPLEVSIKDSIYFNTGDWLNYNTYVKFDNNPLLYYFNQ
jgi:UDP-2,3-diacylglucosamine hydrolase